RQAIRPAVGGLSAHWSQTQVRSVPRIRREGDWGLKTRRC
ncbi:hypothetical protein JMJ77_0006267, partial [Colletotrichum scovillei]